MNSTMMNRAIAIAMGWEQEDDGLWTRSREGKREVRYCTPAYDHEPALIAELMTIGVLSMDNIQRIVRQLLVGDGIPAGRLTVDNPAFVEFCVAVKARLHDRESGEYLHAGFAEAYASVKGDARLWEGLQ